MTKANLRLFLLAGAAASSALAAAQTGTTTHHTSTAAHHTAAHPATHPAAAKSDCITPPTLSPKIPALPAGSPCEKSLFSLTESVQLSPLVGPVVRQAFSNLPMTFTLGYVDTKIGTGEPAKPQMWYTVQYTGYLLDGTKFDSSFDHPEKPFAFPYGAHRVIAGWDLGFEGMHIGGKRRLFIPFQLAYGERGRPPAIPAKADLIFDMELIAQSPTDPNAPPTPPAGANPTPATNGATPSTPPSGAPEGAPQTQPQTQPQAQPQTPPQTPPRPIRPQAGPDVKPGPPTPGAAPATTSQTPPPAPKQPPQP